MNLQQAVSLSDEKTNAMLRDVLEQRNIILCTRNAENISSLTAFITSELQLQAMSFLIIDLRCQEYSVPHIVSALQMLRRFCNTKPIFIAAEGEETDILFGQLSGMNVKECIKVNQNTDIAEEVVKCICGEYDFFKVATAVQNGMIEVARKIASPLLEIPKGDAVTFAVCGAMKRVGTTTNTIGIYNYLKSVGFTPIIIDRSQKLIDFFVQNYPESVTEKENSLEICGTDFCTDILIGTEFNAFIYELGTETNFKNIFKEVDFPIIIGGSKPWEFAELCIMLNDCEESKNKLKIILSFSSKEEEEKIIGATGLQVFTAPFMPDLWRYSQTSMEFYRNIFYNDLKEWCRKCNSKI